MVALEYVPGCPHSKRIPMSKVVNDNVWLYRINAQNRILVRPFLEQAS